MKRTYLQILVIEDDPILRSLEVAKLKSFGRVFEADTLESALKITKSVAIDVAFIDIDLADGEEKGIEFLAAVIDSSFLKIVLTSHDDGELIGRAFEHGCSHYFTKWNFEEAFETKISWLLKGLKNSSIEKIFEDSFITGCESLRKSVLFAIEQAAVSYQNILLLGDTGVGKGMLAKTISSATGCLPFVHVNISELPENLIESELFGHKKGSFTGAIADKEGLLSKADGGILFLDEIGTLPLGIQKKLLRVIEDKSFFPVGGLDLIHSSFKLITATCDDLTAKVEQGEFRLDFYFRIRGIEIKIPALKERRGDIELLLEHLGKKSSQKIYFSDAVSKYLIEYDWPGNGREVVSIFEQLKGASSGIVEVTDLPKYIVGNTSPLARVLDDGGTYLTRKMRDIISEIGLPALINEIEKEAYWEIHKEASGKVNEIGRRLKVSKSLLYRISKDANNEERVNE